MPGGDRTGPMGMGPMTGRGAGYCAGSPAPGFMNRGAGFGRGVGFGRGGGGRGWRNRFYATGLTARQRAGAFGANAFTGPAAPAAEPREVDILQAQADQLSAALEEVKQSIERLQRRSDPQT